MTSNIGMFSNNSCKAPCLNCKNRKVGCHTSCESYLSFHKKNEERKTILSKESEARRAYRDAKTNGYNQALIEAHKKKYSKKY